MKPLGADELYLSGRLQIETVVDALTHTGLNPGAQERLQKLLDAHSLLSKDSEQQDLFIYLRGDSMVSEKADILAGLGALSVSDEVSIERRISAQTLLDEIG